ncbi:Phage-related lysozyme (muraminidase) (COG3772) [uncultured Mediterranean phage uvMED]|nr:Phage-related lysozyme (muraminidase) (COG3772) [uncultured Mediterranean phage uvMED]BAQ86786.1 lysozyme [uncultured Mediterranean phage uvMED]
MTQYNNLKGRIKEHEGYCETVYRDTLGFETGGYGHKIIPGEDIPTDRDGWENLFENDFQSAVDGASRILDGYDIDDTAREVIIEMVFQMGEGGVSKFKGALSNLKEQRYSECAREMLDSRWANQTPNRAKALASVMEGINA